MTGREEGGVKMMGRTVVLSSFLVGSLLTIGNPASTCLGGDEDRVDVVGVPHAKGVVVLRGSFPERATWEHVALDIQKSDSEQGFVDAHAGLPRGWPLLASIRERANGTVVVAPVVGRFDLTPRGFLFPQPGSYRLRWRVGRGEEDGPLLVEQVVRVAEVRPSDARFLSRLSDPTVVRHLFGDEAFERASNALRERSDGTDTTDFWSLTILREVLEITRTRDVTDIIRTRGSVDTTRAWADALFDLVKAFPDSTYTPYAAYYAACSYAALCFGRTQEVVRGERIPGQRKDREKEAERIITLTKDDQDCSRALEAFNLAREAADEYLKPRVLYRQAVLLMSRGNLDEGEGLLKAAEEMASGDRTMLDWISKARETMKRLADGTDDKRKRNGELPRP